MKNFLSIIFLIVFYLNGFTQNDKVDSVFAFYFKVVDTYLSDTLSPSNNLDCFTIIYVDTLNNDTIYKNKYIDDAVSFLQEITDIYPPKNHIHYLTYIVNKETLNLWRLWYDSNRKRLIWSKRKNRPKTKKR